MRGFSNNLPEKQGLYNPEFERDNCGVGFITNIKGKKSHSIVKDGIHMLERMTHRGACGCDPMTGDGAGIMIQVPDEFLQKKCPPIGINLPPAGDYGVGLVFLPAIAIERNTIERWFEKVIRDEGQKFLGWRHVPHDGKKIGEIARSVKPEIKQIFVGRAEDTTPEEFERKLYVIRKLIWNKVNISDLFYKNYFYICGLSTKTLVYKGQLLAEQLSKFFTDLADPDLKSALAIVHSRYSTNTFPTWGLAHPYRMIAHNGEINALKGNVNWMRARETGMESNVYGEELYKILQVVAPNKSDSASFDNVLEMLVMCGRPLPLAIMMMIPEAWSGNKLMSKEKRDFYKFHACMMEPWDGPAAITFSDGRYVGAVLDRNGLRPSRYCIMNDDTVILASEAGVIDIPQENIIEKQCLLPGKIFLIDTLEGKIVSDEELKKKYSSANPYSKWLEENLIELSSLPEPYRVPALGEKSLNEKLKLFSYTDEDYNYQVYPMALEGHEAIGSMGNDTPFAVLSKKPQLLFSYFKQLFAQVTNPPIDSIREEIIMSSDIFLGSEGNLLSEGPENCRRLHLTNPVITNSQLSKIKNIHKKNFSHKTINMLFKKADGKKGLEKSLKRLCKEADIALDDGYTILILSDRNADKERVPMPSLLACSGLHHHLVREGTRTKVSIIVESGEPREIHHFAVLLGYGAEAVNPYLVFDMLKSKIDRKEFPGKISFREAEQNYVTAVRLGLLKTIAKMGISTIQSYCGAQIFEAIGLNENLIDKYFTATVSRLGGIEIDSLAEEMLKRHEAVFGAGSIFTDNDDIDGKFHWRAYGEHHQWNPDTISLLQHAVRTNDYSIFKKFSAIIDCREYSNIRNLLKFKKNNPIPIDEVEPESEIVKRFATGAMSFGSISREAHETLAIAMNRLGGFSNTGEGGEEPARFTPAADGTSRRSRIKQVAPGRFGVSIDYLVSADQIQIKMAQGAKPGEGGQLPGHKVSEDIARTRHTIAGVGLISPPPHHDIYSIEDLAQLIHDLKNANRNAGISVKLVSEAGVGTIAAGVAKAKADHILISGGEGGTGASPLSSIKHAGLPIELGIAETQQTLLLNELRGRVRLQADGQLKTGRDVIIMGMLGADEFGFATSALITMVCVMLRHCHLNTCSAGIATQDEGLRKNFAGKPEHVINFFMFIARQVREIMAELGFRKFNELIGRVDLLEADESLDIIKKKKLDLTNVLYRLDVLASMPKRHAESQNHELEKSIDNIIIAKCSQAIYKKDPVSLELTLSNTDLAVGTMLSSDVCSMYGAAGLPDDTILLSCKGTSGQSLGAFLIKGVTLKLEGEANDYVGKGLSGGKIILFPSKKSAFAASENAIAGNAVLYGAVTGEAYFSGTAGVRFAVRNSGATAVIEGVGDHGCEYMTGGRVVILGKTGRNFAAGMSGGIAYVWDKEKTFHSHCNTEMVKLFPVDREDDKAELKTLIENHFRYTESRAAEFVLGNWENAIEQFVKVYPIDYMRVMEND